MSSHVLIVYSFTEQSARAWRSHSLFTQLPADDVSRLGLLEVKLLKTRTYMCVCVGADFHFSRDRWVPQKVYV